MRARLRGDEVIGSLTLGPALGPSSPWAQEILANLHFPEKTLGEGREKPSGEEPGLRTPQRPHWWACFLEESVAGHPHVTAPCL